MATVQEEDPTAENVLPTAEDTVEELPYVTPERKHVDALIDISEEEFLKELEPFEYHYYSGWEEAVRGWPRVHPMSCIFFPPKTYTTEKHKEAATPTPLPACSSTSTTEKNSSSTAKQHCEWKTSFQKPTQITLRTASWSDTAVAVQQRNASKWPLLNTLQGTTSKPFHKEKVEHGMLRETHHASSKYSVLENRPCKPQRHSRKQNSTMVPIKNFIFLPPIQPSHLHCHGVSGKKASEGGTTEENYFLFDSRSLKRGTGEDSAAELQMSSTALTSECQTCQHNPHIFSAVSVSMPRRYQVPLSSNPDTVHRTSYSVGAQALLSSTAASPQAHMNPNKTVCAVRL